MKRGVVLVVLLITLAFSATAADCGGDIPCLCGDKVTQDYQMQESLHCSNGLGLMVGNDVLLDCNNKVIRGDSSVNSRGIRALTRSTIQNCAIHHFWTGIRIEREGVTLLDNQLYANNHGIKVEFPRGSSPILINNYVCGNDQTDYNCEQGDIMGENNFGRLILDCNAAILDACLDQPDIDADGVLAPFDNCPHTNNGLQEDADNDGVGDACDFISGPNEICNPDIQCQSGLECIDETCQDPDNVPEQEDLPEQEPQLNQGDACSQDDGSNGVWTWSYMLQSENNLLSSNQEPARTACCASGECTDIRGQCRAEGIWWGANAQVSESFKARYVCEDSNWYDCQDGQHNSMQVNGATYTCSNGKWTTDDQPAPEQEPEEEEQELEEEVIDLVCTDTDPANDPLIQGRLDNARFSNGNLIGAPRLDICLDNELVQVDCINNVYTTQDPESCDEGFSCVNGRCQQQSNDPEQGPENLLGDVNFDGVIQEADALLVFDHVAGVTDLTIEQQQQADVNHCQPNQNGITFIDGILIQRKVRNIIEEFPCD